MITFFQLTWLFFCYSFIGWVLETGVSAILHRRYVDRGVLFGPLCVVYGVAGVLITLFLQDLRGNWFFHFLGSAVLATVVEWVASRLLEQITHTRWWDYSHHRFHLDGHISLLSSTIWGLLGVVTMHWVSPLLLALFSLLPGIIGPLVIWILLGILSVDTLSTVMTLAGTAHKLASIAGAGDRINSFTLKLGQWIFSKTEARLQKEHPQAKFARVKKPKSLIFAQGCSFYKIFLLFFIGAFLGDLIETVFCRITMGYWMSRSSVVWGPFSIVWGLAFALATLLLYRYKDKSVGFLFVAGSLLGGVYEYLCSVFTELAFGQVFWDYSHLPFNLGGRVNLLFCFFWGFATIAWLRGIYPHFSRTIERIPKLVGTIITWCLIVFMLCNVAVSSLALARHTQRGNDVPATRPWQLIIDTHFDDTRMEQIYPNSSTTK